MVSGLPSRIGTICTVHEAAARLDWATQTQHASPIGQPLQVEGQGWDIQAQRPLSANSFQWSLDGKIVGTGRLCVIDRVAIGSTRWCCAR